MKVISKTFLQFITLVQLENWSSYSLLGKNLIYTQKYPFVKIGDFLKRNKTQVSIEDGIKYKRATIRINGNGISLRDNIEVDGKEIGTKNQFSIKTGQFLLSKIDARNGAFGVVPEELDNGIITGNFWTFDVDYSKINPHYLTLLTGTKKFQELSQTASVGTTNRNYLQEVSFLNFEIPLPSLAVQEKIVNAYKDKIKQAIALEKEVVDFEIEIENYLFEKLGIEKVETSETNVGLQFIKYEKITAWGIDKILSKQRKKSTHFEIVAVSELTADVFRGKSPKYEDNTTKFILNQKCNRWNELDLSFVKSVNEKWANSIDSKFLTRGGDILINSTGEGTIGRASYITKANEGLIYDSHLLLLRLNESIINPELFVEIFNSDYGQNQVNEIKSAQATKQTELGVSNLMKIRIPLPESLATQSDVLNFIKSNRTRITENRSKAAISKLSAEQEFEQEIFGI